MRLAKTIGKIHRGDIEHTISDYIDSHYDTKFSCSFSIHKSGYDDKQRLYEYMQVEGELAIDYDLTYEDYTIRHTSENWKISGASPTYLRDNMKGALSVHASGTLHGTLNTYSNSSVRLCSIVNRSLRFQILKQFQTSFEGQRFKILKTTIISAQYFRLQ